MGTFHYMSPEQAEGKDADVRSDIFSLGAVLYEMASGRRAFQGKTTASVIAALLERDPQPISSGAADVAAIARPRGENLPGERSRRAISKCARRNASIEMDCGGRIASRRARAGGSETQEPRKTRVGACGRVCAFGTWRS